MVRHLLRHFMEFLKPTGKDRPLASSRWVWDSVVEMSHIQERMDSIYGRAHGGSIFALIDEAFEAVSQSDGTIAVALNVNVTYAASPEPGARLRAEAREVNATKRTASYDIRVTEKVGDWSPPATPLHSGQASLFTFLD